MAQGSESNHWLALVRELENLPLLLVKALTDYRVILSDHLAHLFLLDRYLINCQEQESDTQIHSDASSPNAWYTSISCPSGYLGLKTTLKCIHRDPKL